MLPEQDGTEEYCGDGEPREEADETSLPKSVEACPPPVISSRRHRQLLGSGFW